MVRAVETTSKSLHRGHMAGDIFGVTAGMALDGPTVEAVSLTETQKEEGYERDWRFYTVQRRI
jgi:hypothetical protein